MNLLLSGKAHPLLMPWLSGAQLTSLNKKNATGYRPIAVGDTFRCLASRLCCSAVLPRVSDLLLPYGQVGVGTKGGLEAAIHLSRLLIERHQHNTQMCILKLDFSNAFNQCSRDAFLGRVAKDIPEILGWVQYCYLQPAELRFGAHRILSSSGAQQGDLYYSLWP